MDEELVLRTEWGDLPLGSAEALRRGLRDVARLTGGSSGGGRWSFVFGFDGYGLSESIYPQEQLVRIAAEAADIREVLAYQLSDDARAFLDRLVGLPHAKPGPGSDEDSESRA